MLAAGSVRLPPRLRRRGVARRADLNAMAGIGAFAIPDHEVHRVRALAGQEKLVAVSYSPPSGQTQLSDADRTALQHATLPWLIVTVEELIGYAPRSAAPIAVTVNVHPERLPVPCDNEAMH